MKIWSELWGNLQRNVGNGHFATQLRGYVQITWETNYRKYSKITNLDLVNNPDLALEPETALFILVHGFKHGSFTSSERDPLNGVNLEKYINSTKVDFYNARRVINGTDKAEEIADIAKIYFKTLIE